MKVLKAVPNNPNPDTIPHPDVKGLLKVANDLTWREAIKKSREKYGVHPEPPRVVPDAKRQRERLSVERATYGNSPPEADLAWLLGRHPYPDFRRVMITPEQCEKVLDRTKEEKGPNRGPKERKYVMYARMMHQGRWFFTNQFTALNKQGWLQDGQNRFMACVMSGVPVDMGICVGMPDRNFIYIDEGTPRSGKDTFLVAQEPNAYQLATAIGMVLQYEMWGEKTHLNWSRFAVTNNEKLDALYRYGDNIREGVRAGFRVRQYLKKTSVGASAAAYYLLSEVATERRVVDQFFVSLSKGGGTGSGSPINVLRNDILRSDRRAPMYVQMARILKAWNFTMEGLKPRMVQFDSLAEPFPHPHVYDQNEVGLAAV